MNECFDGIDALLFATKVIDPSQYTNRIKAIKNKKDIDIISTSRKRKVTNFVSYSNLSFNSDDQDTFNKIQQEKKKKKKKKHKHKNKFKNKSNHKHKEKEKEKVKNKYKKKEKDKNKRNKSKKKLSKKKKKQSKKQILKTSEKQFPFENEKSWTQTNYPKEYSFNYTLNKRNNSPLLNRHQPNQGIVLPVSTKIIQPKFTQKDIHSSSDHPTKSSSNLESLQFPFDGIQHLYSFSKTPHLLSLNQDQISKIPLYSLLRQYTFRGLDTSILKAPKYNTKFTQPDYFRQSNILTHSKPSLQLQTHTAIKTKNDNKTNSDTKRGKNTSPQQLLELNLVRWKKSKQNLIRQLKIDNRQTFKKLKKMNKLKIIGNLKLKEK
ncbi:wd repeat domain 60 [Anaeramoeba flamelloides]|uniref:Wd repeat domain 60 n=1 Tax=Anaeramoeba flamelloides TaxID=1746091 RepID=A0ABQ8XFD9_9EUKA|nr:wd repeat domain 60 [Anaeramoeba flamelloides]